MRVYSNDKLIKRNGRIGNISSLASLIVLGAGMFFSFKAKDGSYLVLTFTALIVGFLLFQVGNFYMAKFGKSPRPDERLTSALKGLDDKYSLHHYTTPISHLLVGPAGILCLLPFQQAGNITYDASRKKWKQIGGNFFLKTFGGENLGNPEKEVNYTVKDTLSFLEKAGIDLDDHTPEALLVFTNEKATLTADESITPAVTAAKIKEFVRKKAKQTQLPQDLIARIEEKLIK